MRSSKKQIKKQEVHHEERIRKFYPQDIATLLDKIFSQYDEDKNNRFSRDEFGKILKNLNELIGGDYPHNDDIEDLFNLLDVNGDETIDRTQFSSVLTIFFKLLDQKNIQIEVKQESDIIDP